ncbi:MAG TPA: IS701 family transposase [Baekduia sp.]|uniref:IS701 family transposase n=1 Tax=Baekduia sp. TaxID=2600305 RepID=UPI002C9DA5BE|nr:IS701 family transposase [Baekduia sp.]HMJ34795.1 IS701 family transposase [Baekduia sp.]
MRDARSEGAGLSAVKKRLEAFAGEVLAGAMNRPVQVVNGGVYLRGLIEQGPRKSLEPMCERLGAAADYQSLQQFLADSPWDPALVTRAVAERVAPAIGVQAWVLDDTGFPKDGTRSPGVKRQYSGTLGKIGNCQIGVSVHAVGATGTVPLGWALYLPEEWCEDADRRQRAKIPAEVVFKTKPQLGVELVERAAGWEVAKAPVLGDQAYGDNTQLRERLHDAQLEYVLSVGAETKVFAPGTTFTVPARAGATGRPPTRPKADREPEAIGALIARLADDAQIVTFRDGPDATPLTSRFVFARVRAAHRWHKGLADVPREEWLIAEWPEGADRPTDYWISNLPADTAPERLARLARLRWKIELDYKQLKGELGLDHYEGRSWIGWHHHTALVTAAHGFLTLERRRPNRPRPA